MSSKCNTNKPTPTTGSNLFKLALMPVNGAAVIINTFLQCFHPGLRSAIHQSHNYIQAILTTVFINQKQKNVLPVKARCFNPVSMLLIALVAISISSCQSHTSIGVKKDFNTGLKTEYQHIEPKETMIVMNDEVIGHNDIPLGEKFIIVNKGVKGLTEKEGNVSLGCSLLITDMKGAVILNEPDLFKNTGTIKAAESEYLKCIVSTGQPMEWDKEYKVKTNFWDKWGEGKISNEVTIKMTDIP